MSSSVTPKTVAGYQHEQSLCIIAILVELIGWPKRFECDDILPLAPLAHYRTPNFPLLLMFDLFFCSQEYLRAYI